jgi:hypothetical protein
MGDVGIVLDSELTRHIVITRKAREVITNRPVKPAVIGRCLETLIQGCEWVYAFGLVWFYGWLTPLSIIYVSSQSLEFLSIKTKKQSKIKNRKYLNLYSTDLPQVTGKLYHIILFWTVFFKWLVSYILVVIFFVL